MSSQRGNVNRCRPQKHTNLIAFKNNKHGDTPKTKLLNQIQICNVCAHCQGVLEWKIKYNKYKMLSAPAKCARCSQKTVKQAYTFMCQPCAEAANECAKCGKKDEIVARPGPTVTEKAQMDAKFQHELKSLSERKRRTFLRYLERLEKSKLKAEEEESSNNKEGKPQQRNWMEEAEKRLNLLKLEVEKENKDGGTDEDDWGDSDEDNFDSDEDSSS